MPERCAAEEGAEEGPWRKRQRRDSSSQLSSLGRWTAATGRLSIVVGPASAASSDRRPTITPTDRLKSREGGGEAEVDRGVEPRGSVGGDAIDVRLRGADQVDDQRIEDHRPRPVDA